MMFTKKHLGSAAQVGLEGVARRAKGFNMQVLYADLVRALCVRKITRAGLDVYEREPQIESGLLQMKNVVLALRIASASRETRLRMSMMAAENLIAGLTGRRPPNLVNQEGGTSWSSGNKLQN